MASDNDRDRSTHTRACPMTQRDASRTRPTALPPPTAALATRVAGAVVAAVIGIIHLVESPTQLEEQTYVGVLFIVGGVLLLVAAGAILRATGAAATIGWSLGALIAAGMLVGGILSRTIGLPGFLDPEWEEPSFIASLVLEAVYLALWLWGWALPTSARSSRR